MAVIPVVDDDPAVRMTVRRLLEREGHRVVVAGDGRKRLAEFEADEFDLLFLRHIHAAHGWTPRPLRQVHQLRPHVPIIVISGRPLAPDSCGQPDFLDMAIKLGAICSLLKPFRPAASCGRKEAIVVAISKPRRWVRVLTPRQRPSRAG